MHFFRNASNQLTHDRADIDSLSFPEVCRAVVNHFNLKPSSDLLVGLDMMSWEFAGGVELAWDVWFGFTVTANETSAEQLVRNIATFLCESLPAKAN